MNTFDYSNLWNAAGAVAADPIPSRKQLEAMAFAGVAITIALPVIGRAASHPPARHGSRGTTELRRHVEKMG